MATIYKLLGMFCLVICWGFVKPSGDFLAEKAEGRKVEGLGTMLHSDRNSLSIAKSGRQSSVPVKSKKQQYCSAISTAKPQTQWFGVNFFTAFNFSVANKTKCQCFFDAGGFVKRHLRVIDKPMHSYAVHNNLGSAINQHEVKALPFGEGWEGIIRIAQSQIGVREATGNNDGTQVETYLNYTGNRKGEPWCASFVSWVFAKAGYTQPRTAWSPALFPKNRLVLKPRPANVFGIYFSNLKRIAHCGLVEKQNGNWITTIEGNTNVNGSREGDGVYRKLRHQRSISAYANWMNPEKKGEQR